VNRIDPLGLDWYYNDPNEFPTYIEGSKDNKEYKSHSKTAFRESDHYKYYFGESGSVYIVEKLTGDAMNILPEVVVKPTGGYTNYNSGYSYADLNEMIDAIPRPDRDGVLTLSEANYWYKYGGGRPLTVDASKIKLTGIAAGSFRGSNGIPRTFNLLLTPNVNAGLVYGSLDLTLLTNGNVSIKENAYDFDQQDVMLSNFYKVVPRNIETLIGSMVAGDGIPYMIYYMIIRKATCYKFWI
jgi:hypothetical protein